MIDRELYEPCRNDKVNESLESYCKAFDAVLLVSALTFAFCINSIFDFRHSIIVSIGSDPASLIDIIKPGYLSFCFIFLVGLIVWVSQ